MTIKKDNKTIDVIIGIGVILGILGLTAAIVVLGVVLFAILIEGLGLLYGWITGQSFSDASGPGTLILFLLVVGAVILHAARKKGKTAISEIRKNGMKAIAEKTKQTKKDMVKFGRCIKEWLADLGSETRSVIKTIGKKRKKNEKAKNRNHNKA